MSEKKRAWWKFWQKKPKTPAEEMVDHNAPEVHAQANTDERMAHPPPRRQSPVSHAQAQFSDDPDGTVDLFADELGLDSIDGDTLNLTTNSSDQLNAAPLTEEEISHRVQAARERAARHRGRFGVGVHSSDNLPAASQDALDAIEPNEAIDEPEPTEEPESPGHPAPGTLFAGCMTLLTVLLSLPLWLTRWPPLRDLPGHLGLLAAFQSIQGKASGANLFVFAPQFYAGCAGDYVLALAGAILPLPTMVPLLLQLYVIASLLALLYLLMTAECSLWSACIGLLLLFNGAFFEGNLSFLMSTPFLLVGLAFLLQWMVHERAWGAVAVTATAWVLLLLDPTAYTLFMTASFCCAFLYANTMGSLLLKMLLPASSLLLFLPWLLIVGSANAASFGASAKTATLSWSPYRERLMGLIEHIGWPLHTDTGAIAMAGIALLLLGGIVLYMLSNKRHQDAKLRPFFPVLTLMWLALYLLFPVRWKGTPVTGSALLSFVAISLLGWMHIDLRRTAGKLLLTCAILWGFVSASLFTVTVLQHKQRTKPLQQLLKQVPPNGKLMLWNLPGKHAQQMAQAGGYYMTMQPGNQSNIDLRGHLRWKIIAYKKPYHVPSANAKKRPKLQGWDYLLTGWEPPAKERPFFRLLRKYGKYRLYRIQVP